MTIGTAETPGAGPLVWTGWPLRVALGLIGIVATASSCYLIVSEAITNAVKHSGATRLTVELTRTSTQLRLQVTDDGCGGAEWPLASSPGAGGGAGLTGVADRVDALGGTLTFHSPPGTGTSIVAELPCES